MTSSTPTILSPHLDDAVLSCWHLLQAGEARVLNVFAGSPADSNGIDPWWDRMTGASDPRRRMEERVAEDRQALAVADTEPVNLGFLDEQYRDGEQSLEPIVEAVAGQLSSAGSPVYAPAAIGDVADHRLVRAAALRLAERGLEVRLYADLPHAIRYGWPSWVNGAPRRIDPSPWWEQQLLGPRAAESLRLPSTVHRLDRSSQRRKLEAVLAYKTQIPVLDLMFGGLARAGCLEYEVTWTVSGNAGRRA